jgi:cyclopropane-fatty-acyl-phospholipid synthase
MAADQNGLMDGADSSQGNQRGNDRAFTSQALKAVVLRALKMGGYPRLVIEVVLPGGKTLRVRTETGDLPVIQFHDVSALVSMFNNPALRFGELYADGRVSVRGDLVTVMEALYRGLERAAESSRGIVRFFQGSSASRPPKNTLSRSRANVHKHYDIGNDFYQIWLDSEYQQYTCAYYESEMADLETAQIAKLDLVCRKLALRPGDTVVEAGSGWGGLARYLARNFGVRVRSYNVSARQVEYSRARSKEEGLEALIDYVEDDYRNITGTYDVFVSVGMLEHVGLHEYTTMGQTIDRCLKEDGRGLVHTIGQRRPRRLNPWIEKRIFPGAYAPTLKQMMDIFEPSGFEVMDVENLRSHYALTLKDWGDRFDAHAREVREMFDASFERTWRLYLRGSQAAFTAGGLQLFQVLFRRPGCEAIPPTRDRLFLTKRD